MKILWISLSALFWTTAGQFQSMNMQMQGGFQNPAQFGQMPLPQDQSNYAWGQWGLFSSCSATCGRGISRRQRACYVLSNPSTQGRGSSGSSSSMEALLPLLLLGGSGGIGNMSSLLPQILPQLMGVRQGPGTATATFSNAPNPIQGPYGCIGDMIGSMPCSGPPCSYPSITARPPATISLPPPATTSPPVCLTDWGSWGECSTTCNRGVRLRIRQCNCRDSNSREQTCSEELIDVEMCKNQRPCPTEITVAPAIPTTPASVLTIRPKSAAFWADWAPWAECNGECGQLHYTIRVRKCDGQGSCSGQFREISQCPLIPCPTASITWTNWGPYSTCTTTCGAGEKVRFRTCSTPNACDGDASQTVQCDNELCPTTPSLAWSQWGSYTTCTTTCGVGEKLRFRSCPTPGACPGESLQTVECGNSPCITLPPAPTWSQWGLYGLCTTTCGDGQKTRFRACSVPEGCSGLYFESVPCQNEKCEPTPPPVTWSQWGEYSYCSKTCGEGEKVRFRSCSIPGACEGKADEIIKCFENLCPTRPPAPMWSQWSSYNVCSTTCGKGERVRSRICPVAGACPGQSRQSTACEILPCPEPTPEPIWGDWGSYSKCSSTCGDGNKIRFRDCPIPDACPGSAVEITPCNLERCRESISSVNWNDWSVFAPCNTTCGEGYRIRVRTCPVAGGCNGSSLDAVPCDNVPCLPEWGSWGAYGECSTTCGLGEQIRLRVCQLGSQCRGPGLQSRICQSAPCSGCDFSSPDERGDCGYPGISRNECKERGCCYDDAREGTIWCFFSKAGRFPPQFNSTLSELSQEDDRA